MIDWTDKRIPVLVNSVGSFLSMRNPKKIDPYEIIIIFFKSIVTIVTENNLQTLLISYHRNSSIHSSSSLDYWIRRKIFDINYTYFDCIFIYIQMNLF